MELISVLLSVLITAGFAVLIHFLFGTEGSLAYKFKGPNRAYIVSLIVLIIGLIIILALQSNGILGLSTELFENNEAESEMVAY